MESGMLSELQDMRVLGPKDALRVCAAWRAEAEKIVAGHYTNLITWASRASKPRDFLAGLCSVGFYHPHVGISYQAPSDAQSIHLDWLLTGEDLCDAIVTYRTAQPGGATSPECSGIVESKR